MEKLERQLEIVKRAYLNAMDFLDWLGARKCNKCPYVNIKDMRAPQECDCYKMFLEQAREAIEGETCEEINYLIRAC